MKFYTLGYTSKDIGLQGNYSIIISKNIQLFKAYKKYLQNKKIIDKSEFENIELAINTILSYLHKDILNFTKRLNCVS